MVAGVVAFSSCVAYIAYWRMMNPDKYMAMNEKGELESKERKSRWDD